MKEEDTNLQNSKPLHCERDEEVQSEQVKSLPKVMRLLFRMQSQSIKIVLTKASLEWTKICNIEIFD
jgi:hypothetical protein